MKEYVYKIFLVTGILTLISWITNISFTIDILDSIILILFCLSGFFLLVRLINKDWVKFGVVLFTLTVVLLSYLAWSILGYSSRIDRSWIHNNYKINLEHRLHIAGPGVYWFLVDKQLLFGIFEKRIETRKYQAGLPDPPKEFVFINHGDTIKIECCQSRIRIPKNLESQL